MVFFLFLFFFGPDILLQTLLSLGRIHEQEEYSERKRVVV